MGEEKTIVAKAKMTIGGVGHCGAFKLFNNDYRVFRSFLIFSITLLVFSELSLCPTAAEDSELPPVKTEVKYVQDKEIKNDDPTDAWAEWDETDETRKNPFPRRQRKIEVGMDVNTIMGMAMRQPKVVTAVLSEQFGSEERIGQMVTSKFHNQMAAAGIGCRLWFVRQGRQVVANCETIRDGHMCKDYMIRQPEIIRTVLDNVPFTPRPSAADDDDDDDDDDDESNQRGNLSKKNPRSSQKSSDRMGSTGSPHSDLTREDIKSEL